MDYNNKPNMKNLEKRSKKEINKKTTETNKKTYNTKTN